MGWQIHIKSKRRREAEANKTAYCQRAQAKIKKNIGTHNLLRIHGEGYHESWSNAKVLSIDENNLVRLAVLELLCSNIYTVPLAHITDVSVGSDHVQELLEQACYKYRETPTGRQMKQSVLVQRGTISITDDGGQPRVLVQLPKQDEPLDVTTTDGPWWDFLRDDVHRWALEIQQINDDKKITWAKQKVESARQREHQIVQARLLVENSLNQNS